MKKNSEKSNVKKSNSKIAKKQDNLIKKLFSKKRNLIITVLVLLIIIGLFIYFIFFNKKSEKFVLDSIYDVYPEEVRELYSNFVDASCSGDLYFDIEADKGEKKIDALDKNSLLNYMFSYMDKNNLLTDNINGSVIKNTENKLFAERLNLRDEIKSYQYKNYVYDYSDGKITRKKAECKSDNKYVSYLFGYFISNNVLSIDINMAYLKDNELYNFDNKKLGKYVDDIASLSVLMEDTSYYRVNFAKENGLYKLLGVELNHRS